MRYGLGQLLISVMARDQNVEAIALDPPLDSRLGQSSPREWGRRLRLTRPVDAQRIVHCGATKQSPFPARPHIFERSWIDQQRVSTALQANAQRISMPMPPALRAHRAGICHELSIPTPSQQIDSRVGQGARI